MRRHRASHIELVRVYFGVWAAGVRVVVCERWESGEGSDRGNVREGDEAREEP